MRWLRDFFQACYNKQVENALLENFHARSREKEKEKEKESKEAIAAWRKTKKEIFNPKKVQIEKTDSSERAQINKMGSSFSLFSQAQRLRAACEKIVERARPGLKPTKNMSVL